MSHREIAQLMNRNEPAIRALQFRAVGRPSQGHGRGRQVSTDIETAFHTSLDRLLRGEATLDACVAAYPEHEERLRDMLVVALDLQALAPLPMDRQAVDRGAQLIDEELQRLRARQDRQPEPASAVGAFQLVVPALHAGTDGGSGRGVRHRAGRLRRCDLAAVNSGPDSALYGYRLTLEEPANRIRSQ